MRFSPRVVKSAVLTFTMAALTLFGGISTGVASASASPRPHAAPAVVKTIIHGHPTTLYAVQGTDVKSTLPRMATLNRQEVPAATNPCFGTGLLCLFQDSNGGGAIDAFTEAFLSLPGFWNLTNNSLGSGTWNDQMSSWGNDIGGDPGAATMCWWVDINGKGAGHLMRPLGATIQNVLPSENDQASSVDTQNATCH